MPSQAGDHPSDGRWGEYRMESQRPSGHIPAIVPGPGIGSAATIVSRNVLAGSGPDVRNTPRDHGDLLLTYSARRRDAVFMNRQIAVSLRKFYTHFIRPQRRDAVSSYASSTVWVLSDVRHHQSPCLLFWVDPGYHWHGYRRSVPPSLQPTCQRSAELHLRASTHGLHADDHRHLQAACGFASRFLTTPTHHYAAPSIEMAHDPCSPEYSVPEGSDRRYRLRHPDHSRTRWRLAQSAHGEPGDGERWSVVVLHGLRHAEGQRHMRGSACQCLLQRSGSSPLHLGQRSGEDHQRSSEDAPVVACGLCPVAPSGDR